MSDEARTTLHDRVRRIQRFLAHDLWVVSPPQGLKRTSLLLLRAAVLTIEGFIRSDVFLLAGALSFEVVFALVPLFAVMLALFKGFGGLDSVGAEVKRYLLHAMAPDLHNELIAQIDTFIENINATAIGIVGVLALVYAALSLMHTIEKTLNRIWGVQKSRSLLRSLTVYWSMVTLAPVIIAVSLTMSAFVQRQELYVWLLEHVPTFGSLTLIFAPLAFSWVLFAGMYKFIPSTKVQFGPALVGGVVAGTAWELLKQIYVWYNAHVVTAYKLYGALGSIPVFLLWVYLSWIIVLFGAEVVFALQHVRTYRREVESGRLSLEHKERLAVIVCVHVARPFVRGAAPPTAEELAVQLNAPVRPIREILFELVSKEILREVAPANGKDSGFVPARDPSNLPVRDVVGAIRSFGDPLTLTEGREAARIVEEAQRRAAEALGGTTIKELADS